jgi:serine/threonine protein kinase
MQAPECPPDQELAAFSEGRLSSTRLDSLATHLAHCAGCQTRLASLDGQTDAVVRALRKTAAGDSRQGDEAVRRLLASPPPSGPPAVTAPATPPVVLSRRLGRYRLLGEIGRGGMGIVHRALDEQRQQYVALKTLQGMDPRLLYRFKQEFRTLTGVTHPNLIALHELVSDGEVWFFTMELIDGVDFRSYVRSSGGQPRPETRMLSSPTPPPTPDVPLTSLPLDAAPVAPARPSPSLTDEQLARLWPALEQLARGLHALHRAGKLHRDLKPGNVLVTGEGRVVILDFGLAANLDRAGQHHSSAAMIVGTLPYMAPEQAEAAPVTPAADWYSVGVMLFEALTGQLPFQGTVQQLLRDKQRLDPPPPSMLTRGVPEELDRLCAELLSRDPASRPEGAEVVRRLTREQPAAAPAAPRSRPATLFVGRERELLQIVQAFDAVKQGRTIGVQVRGQSGVGKSMLVGQFLEELRSRRQAVVLEGRCYEQESVPYKGVDSLIDGLSRYLSRLDRAEVESLLPREVSSLLHVFPVMLQVAAFAQAPQRDLSADPRERRRRAFAALRELFARLGDRHPLVLAIDDLQWGDQDSAGLLTELLMPPDPPVLLLLASYRKEEEQRSPFLGEFLGGRQTTAAEWRVLDVDPLNEDAAHALAEMLLAEEGHDQGLTDRAGLIARESRGSPFFVYELVQYLREAGAGTVAGAEDSDLLEEVLWSRIRALPGPARRLLEVVAVAARPLRQADACAAAGLTHEDRPVLSLLRANRLVRGTGATDDDLIESYHDRVRETVRDHLSPEALVGLHGRLAEVLEAGSHYDPEVLALHFRAAGRNDRAARYYALAADRAATAVAFDRAAEFYRQALALSNPTSDEERRLRTALADALSNAGRGTAAGTEYLAAARLAQGLEATDLRRRAAEQQLLCGSLDDGLKTLEGVLREVGMHMPSALGALCRGGLRRLWLLVRGLGFKERPPESLSPETRLRLDICMTATRGLSATLTLHGWYFQTRGLHLALGSGDLFRVSYALILDMALRGLRGGLASRSETRRWEQIDELVTRSGDSYVEGGVKLTRGLLSYMRGLWKPAAELLQEGERLFREKGTGVAWDITMTQVFCMASWIYTGEVGKLTQRWPGVAREILDKGDLFSWMKVNLMPMSIVLLAADDAENARRNVRETMAHWTRPGFIEPDYMALFAEFWIDMYVGDAAKAWDSVSAAWPRYQRSVWRFFQKVRIDMHFARAQTALALGASSERLAGVARDAKRIRREGVLWGAALATLLQAGIANRRGDRDETIRLLTDSVRELEVVDMKLYAEAARRRLGQSQGGEEGRQNVEAADRWMASQQIRRPEKMVRFLAAGFDD